MNDLTLTRDDHAQPSFPLMEQMRVERGNKADWELLHHLHYKAEGAVFGPAYWRLHLDDETIGVLVLGMPKGLLKERHKAMPWIKPGRDSKVSNTARYKMINANTRVVSRIVLDTRFRSIGAAYRFQNLVARLSGYRLIEIQSSMSKYNFFAQKAGFRFTKPMRSNKYEQGVRFFRETFESHPADTEALLKEIEAQSPAVQKMMISRTRKFYYANSAKEKTGAAGKDGKARVEAMPVPELIRQLQQLVLSSPLYGAYVNPDHGRDDMPASLPLTAFDRQAVTDPLILEPDDG